VKRNGFAPLIILLIIVIFAVAGYFFVKSGFKISISQNPTSQTTQPVASAIPSQNNLFTGKLTKLSQDLGLLKQGMTDDKFTYYSAGVFDSGDLNGYTRIIAIDSPSAMGIAPKYILATKDFKTYILNDPDNATTKYSGDDQQNPYYFLDKSKVISTANFDNEQPQSISLDNNFSLYFDEFFTTQENSNLNGLNAINTDFSSFQKLASPDKNLTMYFQSETNPNNKYILGDTKIIVVDSTGLPFVYSLTTPKVISIYQTKEQQYISDLQKYTNKETTTFPTYVYPPHLGFSGSDIVNSTGLSFYKDYETAFPAACAEDLDTKVVNVNDSDLKQIGVANGVAVFGLKDSGSEFNSLQYHSKMDGWASDPADFQTANPGITEPTNVSDYSKNNPLLFIKDYWGRWIALGEWDINLVGGCGKPVIYLYPTRDTKVTLKFNAPVSFTTDIPTYGDSWQVLAHKDGSLTNLKPKLTDCTKIDSSKAGSEYAKDACLGNTYPYIYWSGNIMSVDYPKANLGWVVDKSDLRDFIDSKLQYMGFNEKEKNDFESYWIPEMNAKNSPFYRVSFLTTGEVDQIFPMTVTPTPNSVFRIFMDWQPLDQKPISPLIPEVLPQLVRDGFTMVEWGGLKLP
jgi:hypothetical protein